jgi:hypothetical protein
MILRNGCLKKTDKKYTFASGPSEYETPIQELLVRHILTSYTIF